MPIKYVKLGNSGLKISNLIVGTMGFGVKSWPGVSNEMEEGVELLKKCYDLGLRTFDTADAYSSGKSEEIIGKFITKYNIPRENIVIISKVGFPFIEGDPKINFSNFWELPESNTFKIGNTSRQYLIKAVKDSVRRLGTYIDVYLIHKWSDTPKHETMKALNDLIGDGYMNYIGACHIIPTEFAECQAIADKYDYHKFICYQNYYNLLYREDERDLVPFAKDNLWGNVSLIPFSPLANGLLAKTLESFDQTGPSGYHYWIGLDKLSESDREILTRLESLSKKLNVSMAIIALSWILKKGMFPVVGINKPQRLNDYIQASNFELSDQDEQYLDEPYTPKSKLWFWI